MNIFTAKQYIHPVTRQYFEKIESLGGEVADATTVNTFVVKLSKIIDPQFWVCWPLRSSQNIGSGTTAPSLGLLGDFTATLTNGSTWSADGIICEYNTTQTVTTNFGLLVNGSAFTVIRRDNTTGSNSVNIFGQPGNSSLEFPLTFGWNSSHTLALTQFTSGPTTAHSVSISMGFSPSSANANSYSCSWNPNSASLFVNSNILTTASFDGGSYTLSQGVNMGNIMITNSFGAVTSRGNTCTFPFFLFFRNELTTIQNSLVHNIYKNTLGKGLGLS